MGLLNMLRSGKQAEEITRAFIAGYVFSSLRDDNQRDSIMIHIYRMLSESGPFKMSFDEAQDKFNSSPAIVQAAFMANAMIDLGIQHGIKGFDLEYIPNPFAIKLYPERAIRNAMSKVRKLGIDPQNCFSGPQDV